MVGGGNLIGVDAREKGGAESRPRGIFEKFCHKGEKRCSAINEGEMWGPIFKMREI